MDTIKMASVGALLAGLVLLGAVAFVLLVPPAYQEPAAEQVVDVEFRIVGGEMGNTFGYGLEGQEISSPGPTLRVKVGDVVRITFTNMGRMPHTLALTTALMYDAPVVFGAAIGSSTQPVQPGVTASVTFTASSAGEYYYLCQVPGHPQLGMYGTFIVEE